MEITEELTGQSSQLFSPRKLRTEKASRLVLAWADTLTKHNAWPEGKSVVDFERWLRRSFAESRKETIAVQQATGIPHDAGHGGQGSNAPTNLAPQPRKGPEGNQTTFDKTTGIKIKDNLDHVRTRADLELVDADIRLSQAFEQYLNLGEVEPGKFLSLADFEPYYKTKILHNKAWAPTAEAAESRAQLDRLTKAYNEALEKANEKGSYVSTSKTINDVETNGDFVAKQELIGKNVDEVSIARERKRLQQMYDPDVDPEIYDNVRGSIRFKKLRAIAGALDDIPLAGEAIAATVIGGTVLLTTGNPAVAAEAVKESVPDLAPGISDITADDSSNIRRLPVEGKYEFVDMNRNQIFGDESMGIQERDGEWEKVKRGEGAAGPGMGEQLGNFFSNIGGYIHLGGFGI